MPLSVAIVLLFAACLALLFFSVPRLSAEMKSGIAAAMRAELPGLLRGHTGYVQSGQSRIWYESIDPQGLSKGAVLLFMGISMDALGWPQGFIERLVGAGTR